MSSLYELLQVGDVFLFTFKQGAWEEAELDGLVQRVAQICSGERKSVVVLDMLAAGSLGKSDMLRAFAKFGLGGSAGLRKLVVVTLSPAVQVSTRIFRTICGTADRVTTCRTLQEALAAASL